MAVFHRLTYFARGSKRRARGAAPCGRRRISRCLQSRRLVMKTGYCNFAKASPALLSYDDARTSFIEFAMRCTRLLSDVNYEYR